MMIESIWTEGNPKHAQSDKMSIWHEVIQYSEEFIMISSPHIVFLGLLYQTIKQPHK